MSTSDTRADTTGAGGTGSTTAESLGGAPASRTPSRPSGAGLATLALVARRVGTALLTVLLASFLVFFAVQALPGDVAQQLLGQDATPDAVAALRETLGLDQNVWAATASGSSAPATATSASRWSAGHRSGPTCSSPYATAC